MNLNEKDSQRFYAIRFQLVSYINKKYNIVPNQNDLITSTGVDLQAFVPIRDKIWNNLSLLDEVYHDNPFNLAKADLEILISWKKRVKDRFIILKHLNNYTVMMTSNNLYGVIGLVSPIKEMYPFNTLPQFAEAVLIPFEDKIIYDGILLPYNVCFKSNAKAELNDAYRYLRETKGIMTTL